ncbi:unnamed protein product [Jaminaea pallidilutea]
MSAPALEPRSHPGRKGARENPQKVALNGGPGHVITSKRLYHYHAGSNCFLFRGRFMTADSSPLLFLFTLVIVLLLVGLWLGFEAKWQWHQSSPSVVIVFAYLSVGAVVNMLMTAMRDPGILPRESDRDPLLSQVQDRDCFEHPQDDEERRTSTSMDSGHRQRSVAMRRHGLSLGLDPEDPLCVPVPRIVRGRNGKDLTIKWCETCKLYRPPRSSHCRVCDNCVDSIDHHCNFLNTCIGRRNYLNFVAFLAFAIAACIEGLVLNAWHLAQQTRAIRAADGDVKARSFRKALADSPMSAVLFILFIAALAPLYSLATYHARLMLMNRTTVEQLRIKSAS